MSLARLKPFYVSLGVKHNMNHVGDYYDEQTTADSTILASISETYNSPIVEKASDYLVAIERMELSINAIPFYDSTKSEIIRVVSRPDNQLIYEYTFEDNAYSLSHLFTLLNTIKWKDPNDLNYEFSATFSIDKDGFIIFTLIQNNFDLLYFEFPRRLSQILGISSDRQLSGTHSASSPYPRVDLGDDLDHLLISSNLPTFSDAIGNVKKNILTDFSVPTDYSNGMQYNVNGELIESSFSTSMRQKIIYTPNERRYLELIGDFPINQIDVQVFYLNQDEEIKPVHLAYGGNFEMKIGFFLKS